MQNLKVPNLRAKNLTQDVIWTSLQQFLNVMDVQWTLKQLCVLTAVFLTHDVILTSIQRLSNVMDVETMLCAYKNSFNTRRCLDVAATFFEPHGRQYNVVCLQQYVM